MVADIWRVVARRASSLERRDRYGGSQGFGKRGVIGQAADVRDGERACIEERFAGGNFAAHRIG